MKYRVYQGRKLSSFTLALLGVSFLVVALALPGYLKETVSCIAYPLVRAQSMCADVIRSSLCKRATMHELELALQSLSVKNQALMDRIIEYEAMAHYADGVQELLAFKRRYCLDRACCAQVLTRTLSAQEHFFLVDAGSSEGIQPDMIALYNNVLLGRVVEVYPHYSKVVLISDRGCKVAAYCAQTGASGIHEGCNGIASSSLSRVSHLETVHEQDLVISSGQGLIFPQGFALGKVDKVVRNDLFCVITVCPLIDVTKIAYCMLISRDMVTA